MKKNFLTKITPTHLAKTTVKFLTVLAICFVTTQTVFLHAAKLDTSHSSANFEVRHLKFSRVPGTFQKMTADIDVNKKGEIERFSAKVGVKSIDTRNEKRDAHLKSDDFFSANKFNEITLVMVFEDAKTLTADLTIKGKTKRIKFNKESGIINTSRGDVFGMALNTTINRMDFGVGEGFLAKIISEKVDINLSFEFSL